MKGDLLKGAALSNLGFFAVNTKLDVIEPTLETLSGLTLNSENNSTFFNYDASGNVTEISGGIRQITFTYDEDGNIVNIQKTIGDFSTSKTISYNSSGEVTSILVN
jgi:YD repeat-containing protein